MGTSSCRDAGVESTAYEYVRQHLLALARDWGLGQWERQIVEVYQAICSRSLSFALGTRIPAFSRINHDGTPFQFSVRPGSSATPLQFLGDAGFPGASGLERARAGRDCISTVSQILGLDASTSETGVLLAELAPEEDPQLLADPAGPFWIGAGFASSRSPGLRIYINGSWGAEKDRWNRLRSLASHFGAERSWTEALEAGAARMKPLGSALTIADGGELRARVYVSAYGLLLRDYEALAQRVSGTRLAKAVRCYGDTLLGEDRDFPTPTVVCSFGLGAGKELDFKFEVCCHCLFSSDRQASDRLQQCLGAAGTDPADYLRALEILSEGVLESGRNDYHSFAGVGGRGGAPYFSIYLKPRLVKSQ